MPRFVSSLSLSLLSTTYRCCCLMLISVYLIIFMDYLTCTPFIIDHYDMVSDDCLVIFIIFFFFVFCVHVKSNQRPPCSWSSAQQGTRRAAAAGHGGGRRPAARALRAHPRQHLRQRRAAVQGAWPRPGVPVAQPLAVSPTQGFIAVALGGLQHRNGAWCELV